MSKGSQSSRLSVVLKTQQIPQSDEKEALRRSSDPATASSSIEKKAEDLQEAELHDKKGDSNKSEKKLKEEQEVHDKKGDSNKSDKKRKEEQELHDKKGDSSKSDKKKKNSKISVLSLSSSDVQGKLPPGYPLLQSGYESVQGRRWNMEDSHVLIDDLKATYPDLPADHKYAYYAIFDGHGGRETSAVAETLFHDNLVKTEEFLAGSFEKALFTTYDKTDKEIIDRVKHELWTDGSTVLTVLIVDQTVYIANAGDSECVLGRRNQEGDITPVLLSEKHNPTTELEKARLAEVGCPVAMGRVNGVLAVSRGFGDKDFKWPFNNSAVQKDWVSSIPYVNVVELGERDDFVILACDGLWDTISYQEAVNVVASARWHSKSPMAAAETLVKESLDKRTMDNVSVIVVYLQPPIDTLYRDDKK